MQLHKRKASRGGHEMSRYNPCDLCSGLSHLIRGALDDLFANPQNNLVISRSTHQHSSSESARKAEAKLIVSSLPKILSSERESVLQRLQLLQSFDLIDTEGAACIFERLEHLCHSRKMAEEELCKSFFDFDVGVLFWLECLFSSEVGATKSPPLRQDCGAVSALWNLRFGRKGECRRGEEQDRQRFESALELAKTLSASESILILQLWLLALAAKDASLLVCLSPLESHVPPAFLLEPRSAGFGLVDCDESPAVAYNLALVDFGLKQVRKCWSLEKREEDIFSAGLI